MSAQDQAGFSLVETLVAFVVLAGAAAGSLAALTTAVRAADEAEARFLALQMAERLLWEARTGDPAAYPETGVYGQDRLVWTRTIAPVAVSEDILSVSVSVRWRTGREDKAIALQMYRRGYEDADAPT